MRKILRTIWAAYAVVLFFIILFLSLPIYLFYILFFPNDKRRLMSGYSHTIYARIFLIFCGVKVKVSGKEKINRNQNYVIISNHTTSIDFVINAIASPVLYQYLVKKEILNIPIMGLLIGQFAVMVDRSDEKSRANSIEKLKQTLNTGFSIFLYPEGSRNRTKNKLNKFYNGAFKIAIETGLPLAIQVIKNPRAISGLYELRPGTMEVEWLDIIQTKDLSLANLEELKSQAWSLMNDKIDS